MGVYVNGGIERKMRKLKKWMEREKKGRCCYFNARTEEVGGKASEEEENSERKSKDKKINGNGW